jgi:hypothetical protein
VIATNSLSQLNGTFIWFLCAADGRVKGGEPLP